jgi:hypothetical protein
MMIKLSQLKITQLPPKNKRTLGDMKKVEFALLIGVVFYWNAQFEI